MIFSDSNIWFAIVQLFIFLCESEKNLRYTITNKKLERITCWDIFSIKFTIANWTHRRIYKKLQIILYNRDFKITYSSVKYSSTDVAKKLDA